MPGCDSGKTALLLKLPKEYRLRPLKITDYDKGYLECLGQLTKIGKISRAAFEERFNYINERADTYFIVVLEEISVDKIVGCGTLFIERKFIHSCGVVGHIEDVVVLEEKRGLNLGKWILEYLDTLGLSLDCYKIILDCKEPNIGFYERCNFIKRGIQMAHYFNEE